MQTRYACSDVIDLLSCAARHDVLEPIAVLIYNHFACTLHKVKHTDSSFSVSF